MVMKDKWKNKTIFNYPTPKEQKNNKDEKGFRKGMKKKLLTKNIEGVNNGKDS